MISWSEFENIHPRYQQIVTPVITTPLLRKKNKKSSSTDFPVCAPYLDFCETTEEFPPHLNPSSKGGEEIQMNPSPSWERSQSDRLGEGG